MNTNYPFRRCCLALAIVAVLTGCAGVRPPSAVPAAVSGLAADTRLLATAPTLTGSVTEPAAPNQWWLAIGDAQLDALIVEVELANRDLRSALAAVSEARSLAGEQRWNGIPRGGVSLGASRQRLAGPDVDPFGGDVRGPTRELAQADLSASWELDLFGRIGTRRAIAERGIDLAEADLHAAQALLQAETVAAWAQWRGSAARLRLLEQELIAAERVFALQQRRIDAGLDDPRTIEAPTGWLAGRRAEYAAQQARHAAARNALAVLRGLPPGNDGLPEAPITPLPSVPALETWRGTEGILRRRPDVARADAAYRQAVGASALADRALLPEMRLDFGGGVVQRPGDLDLASAGRWEFAGVVQWNPLDWRRLRAQADASGARADAAYFQLESTLLKAIKDAEDRVAEARAADVTLEQAGAMARSAQRRQEVTRARHRAGLENSIALEEAFLGAGERRRALLDAQVSQFEAHARAHLALATWQPVADNRAATNLRHKAN